MSGSYRTINELSLSKPGKAMIDNKQGLKIVVLLPCYNEGGAIKKVVKEFKSVLPSSEVYVFDNNSTDNTASQAAEAGAIVRYETHQGKGNVVRRMFSDVEADIYVMADGDGTYDAQAAITLVDELISGDLDMVIGTRKEDDSHNEQYRLGHRFGNQALSRIVGTLFGHQMRDVLSGYRVMSRRFVKSFPNMAKGFEIEVMLTIHALSLRLPIKEIATSYFNRAEGTVSKLNTFRDGLRIFLGIVYLFKEYRPLQFFGAWSVVVAVVAMLVGVPVIFEFFETGLVPRFPSAILATGLVIVSTISLTCGVLLDTVSRGHMELKRILYASLPSISAVLRKKSTGE